ncbi:MAG: galactokinase family protein, partial [Pseudohongiella sp.]
MDIYNTANQAFERLYGTPAQHHFQAPGRVNLIGEHTDYNDGFVLPAAIDYQTLIVGNSRADRMVHLVALDLNEARSSFNLDLPIEHDDQAPWSDYVR